MLQRKELLEKRTLDHGWDSEGNIVTTVIHKLKF